MSLAGGYDAPAISFHTGMFFWIERLASAIGLGVFNLPTSTNINVSQSGVSALPTITQWSASDRWKVLAGGFLMDLAFGNIYGWSVFVAPLEKEFGWKRADTSMVFTIAIFMTGLTFLLSGWIYDKWGPSFCAIAGGILASLGFYLSAYTHSLMYLFFILEF